MTTTSDEQDAVSQVNQAVAPQQSPVDEVNAALGQQAPDPVAEINGTIGQPAPIAAIAPKTKGSSSILAASQYLAERLLQQPTGGISAAAELSAAQNPRASLAGATWDTVKRMFPGVSGDEPTERELDKVAQYNPEFAAQWSALKKARDDSLALGNKTTAQGRMQRDEAGYPVTPYQQEAKAMAVDPEAIIAALPPEEAAIQKMRDDYIRKHAGDPSAGIPIPQIPGKTREPISNTELAQAGFEALRAQNAQDIEGLNPWAKAAIRGAAVGGPLGVLQKAIPGGMAAGAAVGAIYEGGRQLLALASGSQKELEPGKVLLSSLLFGAGAKAGEEAAAALPMIPKTAGAVASFAPFEAMNAASALKEMGNKPKAVGGAKEEGPSVWQQFGEHLVEGLSTVLTGAAVGRVGEEKPEGLPSDFNATTATATSMKQALFDFVNRGFSFVGDIKKPLLRENAPTMQSKAKELQVNNDFIPAEAKVNMARDRLDKAIEKASGGDPALRADIEKWSRAIVESGGNIAVPEDIKLPADLPQILDLTREFGKANLGLGHVLSKYGLIPPETMAAREQEGFYFPRSNVKEPTENVPEPTPKQGAGGAPLANKEVAGHFQKREMTFEEAFAQRPLDLSVGRAYQIMQGEVQAGRRMAELELSRADKTLLTQDELPDKVGREAMKQRAAELGTRIADMEKQANTLDPKAQLEARGKITELRSERDALIAGGNGRYYKKLVGEKWGKWEGHYLARDEFQRMTGLDQNHSALVHAYRELLSIHKMMKAGFNVRNWLQDKIGNNEMAAEAGINITRGNPLSVKKNLGLADKDEIDYQFDAFARRASLGGPTDVTKTDLVESSQIAQEIKELEKRGERALALKGINLVTRRGELLNKLENALQDKTPFDMAVWKGLRGAFSIPRVRQLTIDLADARTAYRELVKNGVGDSGPMKPADAFDYVQKIWDYRTLPKSVQASANFFTWMRYPAKWIQSTLLNNAARKPSLFGKTISTPLDTVIAGAPGSPEAQAALVGRGMMRLATTGSRWLLPLFGLQAAAAAYLGISRDKLNRYLDSKFDYLPDPVAWLVKKVYVPTKPPDANGDIDGIDAGQAIPALVALRYFSSSSKTASLWWQLAQKNALTSIVTQVAAQENVGGKPVAKGWGPGESRWPAVAALLPNLVSGPLEAYFQAQRVPEDERNALRDVARTLIGIPMLKLNRPDVAQKELERYYNEGVLGREVRDDGSWNYFLMNRDSPVRTKEQVIAETWLEIEQRAREMDPHRIKMQVHRVQEAMQEQGFRR